MIKIDMGWVVGLVLVVAIGSMMGCREKTEQGPGPGIAEKTGAALDRTAEKTIDMTKRAGEKATETASEAKAATTEAAEKTVEKTGELLEKTGEELQK